MTLLRFRDGMTETMIANLLGYSRGTVSKYIGNIRRQQTVTPMIKIREIFRLRRETDLRIQDIAKEVGVSRYTVSKWIKVAKDAENDATEQE